MSTYIVIKSTPSGEEWEHQVVMWYDEEWDSGVDVDYLNRTSNDGTIYNVLNADSINHDCYSFYKDDLDDKKVLCWFDGIFSVKESELIENK